MGRHGLKHGLFWQGAGELWAFHGDWKDRSKRWVGCRVFLALSGTRPVGMRWQFWRVSGNSVDCAGGCDVWTRSQKAHTSGRLVPCWHWEYSAWWSSGCVACPRSIHRPFTWLWRLKQTCMTSLRHSSASDSAQLPVWRRTIPGNPFTSPVSGGQLTNLKLN